MGQFDRRHLICGGAGLLVIALLALPYMDLKFEILDLAMSVLIFSLAAIAFNVLLGYTGLLSFGHAAFFGGAAYLVAIVMNFAGITEFLILLPLGIAGAFGLSVIIGWVSVRYTGTYYALLMLALAQMMYLVVSQLRNITGGSQGIGLPNPTFLGVNFAQQLGYLEYLAGIYYYVVVFIVGIGVVILWLLMRSSFGLTLRTVRENPERARSIGIPVKRYRWYATIVSGTFTGIAGVLFAFKAVHVTPDSTLYWLISGEIAIMAILGGIGTFLGPAVGALTFLVLKKYTIELVGGYWMLVQGLVLLAIVLVLRKGIYESIEHLVGRALDGHLGSLIAPKDADDSEEVKP